MTIEEMNKTLDCISDDTVMLMSEVRAMLKCIVEDEFECDRAITCFTFEAYDIE